jgi:hypothetical protein
MRTKPAARPRSAKLFDALRSRLEALGNALLGLQHEPPLVRMESDGVALGKHALDQRRGLLGEVVVDQQERCACVFALEDVEQ